MGDIEVLKNCGSRNGTLERERYRLRRNLYRTRSISNVPDPVVPAFDPELIEQLDLKLAMVTQENASFREIIARQKADFDNFRRRSQKDKEQARESVREDVLAKLLAVADNFDRALESTKNATDAASIREGVSMVAGQLHKVFQDEGMERIDAMNALFDPNEHEALAVEEREDFPENHVCEVMLPGYRLKDKILRPAMVKVARAPQKPEGEAAVSETEG
jgi:molecular chaperone GrpE